jgi:hypothetical protein
MPTSDFWTKGSDVDNVVGGPARILVSERSATTYPELISEIIDLSTYDPMTGWSDVGHTSEPLNIADGFETTEWVSQQLGIIDIQTGNWNRSLSFTMMEVERDIVMRLAHEGTTEAANADSDMVQYFWDKSCVTEWRVAAISMVDGCATSPLLICDIFPRAKRSGADSETSWDRTNPQTASVELTPLPDDNVPNDANWYRIRQTG